MIHGLNNTYLYTAKMIVATWSNNEETLTVRGTGFFIQKDDDLIFVTNRHMVEPGYSHKEYENYELDSFDIISYQDVDDNGIPCDLHTIKVKNYKEFCFSKNNNNDIACLRHVKLGNGSARVISPIPYSLLATKEELNGLSVCDSIAYPGFPIWYDKQNETPIFRMGTIASDPRLNYSNNSNMDIADRVAYEGFSSSGASGSPVFSLQKGFPIGNGLEYSGEDDFYRRVMLIGINAGHFNASNGHSGISYFYKSSAIVEVIDEE